MTKKIIFTALTVITLSLDSSASVPTAAQTFETNIKVYNMTKAQEKKVRDAESKIKDVVSSEAFRNAVLNHKYNGKKTFVDNRGLTNSQIYTRILEAAETKSTARNNRMDMGIKLYYANNNVVGWTNPSITHINCNTKFFNTYNANLVSGNMMHEWLHKIGFGHSFNYTKARDYSVPYAIGSLMAKLAAKY